MIDSKRFQKIKAKYHRFLAYYYKHGKYEQYMHAAYNYCVFQHKLNQELTDTVLENQLLKISSNQFPEETVTPNADLIMLYDSIGVDNIALSYHYLSFLVDSGRSFVYVVRDSGKNRLLLEMAENCENCLTVIHYQEKGYLDTAKKIRDVVTQYSPATVIMHMNNTDVAGFVGFSNLNGIQKFYINHGDEQFWIGKALLDYCIEFRSTGKDISHRLREIPLERILLQPYYPIIQQHEFCGLELQEENQNRKIIFSGGRFVKTYGRNFQYLKMVRDILYDNENACFVFAGNGNSTPMQAFVRKSGLERRWIITTYRPDLYEVIKRADVYLSTFPLFGGLMTQTAAVAGTPIVELNANTGNSSYDVLPLLENCKIVFDSVQECSEQVKCLLGNDAYKDKIGKELQKSLISKELFDSNFYEILSDKKSRFVFTEVYFDQAKSAQDYLDAENNGLHSIPLVLRNRHMLRFYPITFMENALKIIVHNGIPFINK